MWSKGHKLTNETNKKFCKIYSCFTNQAVLIAEENKNFNNKICKKKVKTILYLPQFSGRIFSANFRRS